jgi:transcriptional regulator with XRE-family HTH domain
MVNYGMMNKEQMFYRFVGERIRVARQRSIPRISQVQLANHLNMSRASVVNIEAGRQHPPLHILWEIAEFLNIEVRDLIPSQAEYTAYQARDGLDERMVAAIEEQAAGNEETRRLLTEFVGRAKAK